MPNENSKDDITPAHYRTGDTYECVKVAEAWGLHKNAYLFNVLKYVSRHELKGTALKDLKKAAWYLAREIANLEKEEAEAQAILEHVQNLNGVPYFDIALEERLKGLPLNRHETQEIEDLVHGETK